MREALVEWRPEVDREIERMLPRNLDADYLAERFGAAHYEYDEAAIDDALSTPVWDLLDRGGKRWRAVAFLVLADGLGGDPAELLPYATIPEILHNGTIVVDDVEDEATMRRGEKAVHHRYGVDVALNAGNALYFIPLKIISQNPAGLDAAAQLRIYEMLTYELNRTHLGQGMDIRWHNDDAVDITEDAYMEMCACKTGSLGRIVGRLAAIVTGHDDAVEEALAQYMEKVCIAFQIGDDILDVEHTIDADRDGDFGKAFGNDIHEGKKTLMAVHAVANADPERAKRLEAILADPASSDEDVLEAIDIIQSTDGVEYARKEAYRLSDEARAHLDDVPLSDDAREQMVEFARFVVERDA